jgi:peptidoglycan/LPS O-acetylase OafA/YrhL
MRVGRGRAGQEAYMRYLVLGLGVLVVLVSALADVLGIGGEPGFGYAQDVGVLVGAALIIAGVRWGRRR